jgi:hypothetical protein
VAIEAQALGDGAADHAPAYYDHSRHIRNMFSRPRISPSQLVGWGAQITFTS